MAGFSVNLYFSFKKNLLVMVDSEDKSGLTFRCAAFSSPPTPATTNSQALAASILNMRPTILLLTLLISSELSSCKQTKSYDPNDIRGVWVAITNDSIYEEIIVTEKEFYFYDEHGGDILLTYELENDSLKLFFRNGLQSKRKFKRISEDAFLEQDDRFTVIFNRLQEFVDTSKVLSTKRTPKRYYDEEYHSKYVWDMRLRRHEWDSAKNASR
jgi:hypothetical protein